MTRTSSSSPPREPTKFRRQADERYANMSCDEVVHDVNKLYGEYKKNSNRLNLCIALGALKSKFATPGQPHFKDVVKEKCSVSHWNAARYAKIGRSPDPESAFADFLVKEAQRQKNHRNRQKDKEIALRNAMTRLRNAEWTDERKLNALYELVDAWGLTTAQLVQPPLANAA